MTNAMDERKRKIRKKAKNASFYTRRSLSYSHTATLMLSFLRGMVEKIVVVYRTWGAEQRE